jgi:hypothetical protein
MTPNRRPPAATIRVAAWILLATMAAAVQPASAQHDAAGQDMTVHLYFGHRDSPFLASEQRVVAQPKDASALARRILAMLIEGPREPLQRTLPSETVLRALYLTDSGTAYVDFGPELAAAHPGGIGRELLTVYSVVNSLVLNVDRIERVHLLIGGAEAQTLAGHVDLTQPFNANLLLVR